jgi:hypothetical protein
MTGSLIPPSDLAPPSALSLTPDQRIRAWIDLMESAEQLFLAGLRHRIGPDGDLQEAIRQWYRQDREQHDRDTAHLIRELARREGLERDGR